MKSLGKKRWKVLKQQKDKEEKARLKAIEKIYKKDYEIKEKIMENLPKYLKDLLEEKDISNEFENILGKTCL